MEVGEVVGQRRERDSFHFLGSRTSTSQRGGGQHRLFREFEMYWYVEKRTWNVSPAFMTQLFLYRRHWLHLLGEGGSVYTYVEKFRRRHEVANGTRCSPHQIKWFLKGVKKKKNQLFISLCPLPVFRQFETWELSSPCPEWSRRWHIEAVCERGWMNEFQTPVRGTNHFTSLGLRFPNAK